MHLVATFIDIRANPARVWRVLTAFADYPAWNPFITAVEGTPAVGARLLIRVHPPGGSAMAFRPRVLIAEPERQLRWKGRLILPGLFDGEHSFRLEPIPGGVRLHHEERFTGLLAGVMPASSYGRIRQGFEAMNTALKARVEEAAVAA